MTHATPANHHRENALLLAAVRNAAPPSDIGDTLTLNWKYLLAAANRQGVRPLLSQWRDKHAVSAPPEATDVLHAAYWENYFRTRTLLAELAAVRAAAAAEGIVLLPLKGAALAPTVYPSPDLRPMSDLDVLARASDLARTGAVLTSLGYREEPDGPTLLPPRMRDLLRGEHKFTAIRGGFALLIEVRAEPLDPGFPPLSELDRAFSARLHRHAAHLWQRATIGSDPTTAYAAPENLLLHVTSHMTTRHADFRLIWLCDVREILTHAPEFDWDAFARDARTLDLVVPVRAALDAAARWLDVPVPTSALASLAPRRWHVVDRLEQRSLGARAQALDTTDLTAMPPAPIWLAIAAIARVSWSARIQAIRWLILPGKNYLAGWRNTPGATLTSATYARVAVFRLLTAALLALAAVARLLRLPFLPARVDRLMQRVDPFGQYVK